MCLNKMTIFYQTCLIPFIIAFFKIFNQRAWIFVTVKTVGQRFFFDTVFYFTFATMLRFSFVAVQTTGTRFFVVTMLITDLTIHSAWSKHTYINFFFWHFHNCLHLSSTTDLSSFTNSDLSVCTGEIIPQPIRKSNLHFPSVPPIQTVKGRVVFFRKEREKISTLKPLTVWIFAVAISPPKTGNRIKKSCPRFRPLHSNGKTVCTTSAAIGKFCGGSAPAPPTSSKEQNRVLRNRARKGLIFKALQERKLDGVRFYTTHPRKRLLNVHRSVVRPFFLPVPRRSGKFCVNNSKKHLTKRFMGDSERY